MTWPVELAELLEELIEFRDVRGWQKFHTIKNLVCALSVESAELLELVQWKSDPEVSDATNWKAKFRSNFQREVADIFIYLTLICEAAEIDPMDVIRSKIEENAAKYPIEKSRGNAIKYSEFAK